MIKIYVPKDSSARAMGADDVADAITAEAAAQNVSVQIIRNGSRGLAWLEPLVEVETAKGRIAFGPVEAADAKALVKSGFKEGLTYVRNDYGENAGNVSADEVKKMRSANSRV